MTDIISSDAAIETKLYDENFYNEQIEGSYQSAKIYVAMIYKIFQPKNIVDLGCGRGTWLKAFKEAGAEKVLGLDGFWNTQNNMIDKNINFQAFDLNHPIKLAENEKFDLAMSLEVAEHLEASAAETFITSLTNLADVVLFSAAYIKQGGTNHINEQQHSYWAKIFKSQGYVPFDIFRPVTWGNQKIEYWYQQNAFLYIRESSIQYQEIIKKGIEPMQNIAFMDCVHPELYNKKLAKEERYFEELEHARSQIKFLSHPPGVITSIKYLLQAIRATIKRRFYAKRQCIN